jgi:mannosyltransferase OCH1-like enzyme
MHLIPKVIYQTWKNKNLDPRVRTVIDNIQKLNPDYKMVLFDDEEIENWIKHNFDEIIFTTYKKIKVGAGKADFWRYLILYMNGGIYLDIDSNIVKPLDQLINENDMAIITREKNSGTDYFVQWCLMFSPKHPILLRAINLCIYNIHNKTTTYLVNLTGPAVFTDAVNYVLKKKYSYVLKKKYSLQKNLFYYHDRELNELFNRDENSIRCRFYGKDYEGFCDFDNGTKDVFLKDSIHWKEDKEIFSS